MARPDTRQCGRPGWFRALLALLLLLAASSAARAERRVAFVVGNGDYRHAPVLTNPRNDASDLAARLGDMGFEVVLGQDLDKAGMEAALVRFGRLAQDADAALVFFAGHGVQNAGENYLLPIDARLEDEVALRHETIRMQDVVAALDSARGVARTGRSCATRSSRRRSTTRAAARAA